MVIHSHFSDSNVYRILVWHMNEYEMLCIVNVLKSNVFFYFKAIINMPAKNNNSLNDLIFIKGSHSHVKSFTTYATNDAANYGISANSISVRCTHYDETWTSSGNGYCARYVFQIFFDRLNWTGNSDSNCALFKSIFELNKRSFQV